MTKRRVGLTLTRDVAGAAAVEMALVLPLLLLLMFGAFELGHYFYSEHVIQKAVRDGARYAARQPMGRFVSAGGTGTGCRATPEDPVTATTRNLVRTGQVAAGGSSRIAGWTDPATITLSVACFTTADGEAMSGIYSGMAYGVSSTAVGAPVITVTAAVPYMSLFGTLGLPEPSLTLNARSQAAVMGI